MDAVITSGSTQTITISLGHSREFLVAEAARLGRDVPPRTDVVVPLSSLSEAARAAIMRAGDTMLAGTFPAAVDSITYAGAYEPECVRLELDQLDITAEQAIACLEATVSLAADNIRQRDEAAKEAAAKQAEQLAARQAEARAEAERRKAAEARAAVAAQEAERMSALRDAELKKLVSPILTSPSQIGRLATGFMGADEIVKLLADHVFDGQSQYVRLTATDVAELCDAERDEENEPRGVTFSVEVPTTLTDDQWERLEAVKTAFPQAAITLRKHVGAWDCGDSDHPMHRATRMGVLVRVKLSDHVTVSRELAL